MVDKTLDLASAAEDAWQRLAVAAQLIWGVQEHPERASEGSDLEIVGEIIGGVRDQLRASLTVEGHNSLADAGSEDNEQAVM
jgi:hypothetical protein